MTLAALPLTERDEPAAATVLADAFYDDPFVGWMYPNAKRRHGRHRRMVARMLRLTRPRARPLWNGGAIALWMPPGEQPLTARDQLRMVPDLLGWGLRAPRVMAVLDLMDREHPKEPHWYLFMVGSDPARRGQGHGQAVIQPVLDECDRDGIPAYLESSNPANIPYYARFGFEVIGELRRAGSPPQTQMWRDPRRPSS